MKYQLIWPLLGLLFLAACNEQQFGQDQEKVKETNLLEVEICADATLKTPEPTVENPEVVERKFIPGYRTIEVTLIVLNKDNQPEEKLFKAGVSMENWGEDNTGSGCGGAFFGKADIKIKDIEAIKSIYLLPDASEKDGKKIAGGIIHYSTSKKKVSLLFDEYADVVNPGSFNPYNEDGSGSGDGGGSSNGDPEYVGKQINDGKRVPKALDRQLDEGPRSQSKNRRV